MNRTIAYCLSWLDEYWFLPDHETFVTEEEMDSDMINLLEYGF